MYYYLLINIFTLAGPLAFSFDKHIKFYRNIPAVLFSYIVVSIPFIIWDAIATERGHWHFNPDYIIGFKIFGLPIEEILFFITVPYACLFTYEAIVYYLGDKKLRVPSWPFLILAALCILGALLFIDQEYTFIDLFVFAFFLITAVVFKKWIINSKAYWIYLLVTIGFFIIVNYLLTSIPIVQYGSDMIWGSQDPWNYRFITIPFEDFFYNVSMLGFYLVSYIYYYKKYLMQKSPGSLSR
ncbi:MAG: lycopene cyclase domain-containing protein [Thermoplasmata archaeon]|nr:MAG: lycopene cyclase domain-containing protein [Thermoplasmata archaeon]